MRVWKKRGACIGMAVVLVFGIIPPLPVKASAATISAEASTEILMMLWNLMINGMLAGGAAEMAIDYNCERLTFEAFMDTLAHDILGMPEPPDFGTFALEDGTQISIADFIVGVKDGEYEIPDVEDWVDSRERISREEYLYLEGFWDELEGGGSKPPEPDDNDDFPEPKFNKIKSFVLGGGIFSALAATVSKLFNGEIEGVDPSLYLPSEYGFTSYEDMLNADGTYHIVLDTSDFGYTDYYGAYLFPDGYIVRGHCETDLGTVNRYIPVAIGDGYWVQFYLLDAAKKNLLGSISASVVFSYHDYLTGEVRQTRTSDINAAVRLNENFFYSTNIPVYASKEDAIAGKNVLNPRKIKTAYDPYVMVRVIPDTFAPITGKRLPVSSMQDMYARMKNGYQTQVKPQLETETDTDKNTQTYIDVMTGAAEETGKITVTDPGPVPEPTPEPETETEEETTPAKTDIDIKDYKVDLKEVFPFCIPFDYISLLKALSAEPEAPSFEIPFVVPMLGIEEHYQMDLALFDDVMVIIRRLELVGFIISLMFITHKMIKW